MTLLGMYGVAGRVILPPIWLAFSRKYANIVEL
jgi:hypothetical protein